MSTTVSNIKTNLQARALSILPSYSKHSYSVDVSKNKFKGNKSQLSVLPASAAEVEGLIGAFTLDHIFTYTLTNSYNAGAKSQLNDSLQAQRVQELQDDILTIYTDALQNKGSIDSTVLVINDLQLQEPEYDDDEKVITITASITVKYKTNT